MRFSSGHLCCRDGVGTDGTPQCQGTTQLRRSGSQFTGTIELPTKFNLNKERLGQTLLGVTTHVSVISALLTKTLPAEYSSTDACTMTQLIQNA